MYELIRKSTKLRSMKNYQPLRIRPFSSKVEATCINDQCLTTLTGFSLLCSLILTYCPFCEHFNFSKCLSPATLLWIKRWG